MSFLSAKGVSESDTIAKFQTKSFKEPVDAHVLDDGSTRSFSRAKAHEAKVRARLSTLPETVHD